MRRIVNKSKMTLITVHFPKHILRKMEEILEAGLFPSRSELIRHAVLFYINYIEERRMVPREKLMWGR